MPYWRALSLHNCFHFFSCLNRSRDGKYATIALWLERAVFLSWVLLPSLPLFPHFDCLWSKLVRVCSSPSPSLHRFHCDRGSYFYLHAQPFTWRHYLNRIDMMAIMNPRLGLIALGGSYQFFNHDHSPPSPLQSLVFFFGCSAFYLQSFFLIVPSHRNDMIFDPLYTASCRLGGSYHLSPCGDDHCLLLCNDSYSLVPLVYDLDSTTRSSKIEAQVAGRSISICRRAPWHWIWFVQWCLSCVYHCGLSWAFLRWIFVFRLPVVLFCSWIIFWQFMCMNFCLYCVHGAVAVWRPHAWNERPFQPTKPTQFWQKKPRGTPEKKKQKRGVCLGLSSPVRTSPCAAPFKLPS